MSPGGTRLSQVLEILDAAAVRRWCAAGLDALRRHQREIDELNVYPVPDGDTGTNLVLTLTSAHQALESDREATAPGPAPGPEAPHARALRLMARGALLGARGNSGVIISQILRGLAEGLAGIAVVRGAALAGGLRQGATMAYAAVAEPVEGTILSVAAASAESAGRAGERLADVALAAATGAAEALARTPQQLAVLSRAGVVDAGGRGLVVLLDALVSVVAGRTEPPARAAPRKPPTRTVTAAREAGSEEFAYEVQYLLDATETAVGTLRGALGGLGDSLVVVGTGAPDRDGVQTWNVHVHVNDVGAAIEAGVEAGRPHRISVTRFAEQIEAGAAERATMSTVDADTVDAPTAGATTVEGATVDPAARAAVVVAPGPGLADLFGADGAVAVPAMPSPAEILAAIRTTGAGEVVVLPNDPNSQSVAAVAAAEAAAEGVTVRVIPTRSAVQALAALAVRDPLRPFDDDVIAMAEAAGACRYAEVTIASREALTVAGRCRPGDVLALIDGEVNLIGNDLVTTCRDLLDRLLAAGGELVTLIVGAESPAGFSDTLAAHAAAAWPFVEVQVYPGGQPHYPLLVGVE
jgi:DAK2 domain fusion protein YloV